MERKRREYTYKELVQKDKQRNNNVQKVEI